MVSDTTFLRNSFVCQQLFQCQYFFFLFLLKHHRYSYHFPELAKIVTENYKYAKVAQFIKDRKTLTDESLEGLEEILMDSAAAQAIIDASKMSMGMDISVVDLINIEMFATRVVNLSEYRKRLAEYLHTKMESVAPNLQVLIGDQVGARLISHAGSLTNLAKYPASTVQILGAEKALFRALKSRTNTPKYGLLYHSTFIGRAGLKNKGRISRFLANKCSIASRIDCFLGKFINDRLGICVGTGWNNGLIYLIFLDFFFYRIANKYLWK